jgi:putative transposase
MNRKDRFISGNFYHIYSRTALNVPEFKKKENANKLVQAFLLANSTNSGQAFNYLRNDRNANLEKAQEIIKDGKKLVDILCYVIMPDHYHLLLRQLIENGITEFIRKCNTSIAKYINIKNDRTGSLFGSCFKSKYIDSNEYLLHLSLYIHLNPLDFIDNKNWRYNKLRNWRFKKEKLLNYPWSSLRKFLNEDYKDPILSGTEMISNQFSGSKEYELFLREWSEGILSQVGNLIID